LPQNCPAAYVRILGRGKHGEIYWENLIPALVARRANAEDRQDRVIASPSGKLTAGDSARRLSLPSEDGKDALAAFSRGAFNGKRLNPRHHFRDSSADRVAVFEAAAKTPKT
jgi:hypothetical protein